MKPTKILLGFFVVVSLAFAPLLSAKEAKAVFKVSGMSCSACAPGLEASLGRLPGVKSATVSYKEGRATIVYDDAKVTGKKLEEAIEQSGFQAELQRKKGKAQGTEGVRTK